MVFQGNLVRWWGITSYEKEGGNDDVAGYKRKNDKLRIGRAD